MSENQSRKTFIQRLWERWEGCIQFITVIAVPIGIGVYIHNWAEKGRQELERLRIESDYIQMATGILSQKVAEGSDQSAIREWAVAILDRYSPVELKEPQKEALISGESRLSQWGYSDYRGYAGDYYIEPAGPKTGN